MDKTVKVGIGVMILKDNKVLLGKRNSDSKKADSELHGESTWSFPGGKPNFGERITDTAKREVLEETGMKIKKLNLISVSNDVVPDAHFITLGFLCEDFEGEPKIMEPDEIIEWKWFSLNTLPKPLFFPCEKMIRNYIDKEIYKGD